MTRGKNRLYPHLLAEDIAIWEQFLNVHRSRFTHIDYDVRVGEGRPVPPDTPPPTTRDWEHLTKRRIDAVGHTERTRWIIEVTHTAGLRAVGQCLSYPFLYIRTFKWFLGTRALLVAGRLQPDIANILTHHKIQIWTPAHQTDQWRNP